MKGANRDSPSDLIHQLAEVFHSKVRVINHRDPNVMTDDGASDLTFRESIKFRRDGVESEVRFNGYSLVFQCKADLDAGVWSINQQDKVMLTRRTDKGPASVDHWPLFVAGKVPDKAIAIWHSKKFRQLLADMELGPGEGLHFYKNAVSLYVKKSTVSSFTNRCDLVLSFLASISSGGTGGGDRRVIMPDQFRDLEDIAQRWAISDDDARSEAVYTATKQEREELVQRIMPRMGVINDFLADHNDVTACFLGALARAASEAKVCLDAVKH